MKAPDMKALRRTAAVTAVAVYGMIVLGAVVRSTNSGLSCPDWPTCYGQLVLTPADFAALPETGYTYTQVMLEWGHRALAALVIGPLILAMAVMAWRGRGRHPRLPLYGGALVVLLLIQGSLGGVTVLDSNSPWSVALHLVTALLILSTILLIRERARDEPAALASKAPVAVKAVSAGVWVLALAAMASAAMTAKSGASLACSTWPDCDGFLVPPLDDPLVRIHFAHRTLAAATGLGLLLLFALTRDSRRLPPGGRGLASLALGLVTAQVLMGALVIVLQVPIWTGVLHQALGVVTLAVVTTLMWRVNAPAIEAARDGEPAGHARLQGT